MQIAPELCERIAVVRLRSWVSDHAKWAIVLAALAVATVALLPWILKKPSLADQAEAYATAVFRGDGRTVAGHLLDVESEKTGLRTLESRESVYREVVQPILTQCKWIITGRHQTKEGAYVKFRLTTPSGRVHEEMLGLQVTDLGPKGTLHKLLTLAWFVQAVDRTEDGRLPNVVDSYRRGVVQDWEKMEKLGVLGLYDESDGKLTPWKELMERIEATGGVKGPG